MLGPGLLPSVPMPLCPEAQSRDSLAHAQSPAEALTWIRAWLPSHWRAGWETAGVCYTSLHPSAAPPRGEHCPVAHGINHVSPRDYGTSEQVKQVMEEAAQFLPYTVAELSQEKSRQLRGLPASVRTGLQCSWGKKIARLTHQPLKSYWKYCCSSDYILLLI